MDADKGNLRAKVFFVWGGALVLAFLFAFFFIPETKNLTLEQVDKMLEETTPMSSGRWKPNETFAHTMGMTEKEETLSTTEHVHQNVVTERMRMAV